jgi:hypothetical protein
MSQMIRRWITQVQAYALLRDLAEAKLEIAHLTALIASADRQSAASASRRENSNDQGGERPPHAELEAVP